MNDERSRRTAKVHDHHRSHIPTVYERAAIGGKLGRAEATRRTAASAHERKNFS